MPGSVNFSIFLPVSKTLKNYSLGTYKIFHSCVKNTGDVSAHQRYKFQAQSAEWRGVHHFKVDGFADTHTYMTKPIFRIRTKTTIGNFFPPIC